METTLDKGKLAELADFIDSLPNKDGGVVTSLHKAQELFGYLLREAQSFIAARLSVPAAKVYGVTTFYSYFSEKPKGRHKINVCLGTACFVRGARDVAEAFQKRLNCAVGETTADGAFSLDVLRCVGACGLAPVVGVDGKIFGRVKPDDIDKILSEYGGMACDKNA